MFTVAAYPTSFYASPTGFSPQSIAISAQNCTSCHGPNGQGDGPAAKDLQPPPVDLTAGHIPMSGAKIGAKRGVHYTAQEAT
jgi:mono/diheme cytochrome c family protein